MCKLTGPVCKLTHTFADLRPCLLTRARARAVALTTTGTRAGTFRLTVPRYGRAGCPLIELTVKTLVSRLIAQKFNLTKSSYQFFADVVSSQVRAGLWARNGRSMHQVVAIYCIYEGGADLDLFLLQCLAVLLPGEPFVQRIVDTFGLK
eukprot:7230616-Pyramimonas_sp.AAC.1